MIKVQILPAQVLYINHYKKDKLLLQENMCEQDKSKTHYFLQTHSQIMYEHDTTTSYQGNGTTFSIFASLF